MDLETREQLGSLFWLVFAAIVCAGSLKLSLGTLRQPGTGFFPFLGGAALALCSFLNLLRATLEKRKRVVQKAGSLGPLVNWKNVVFSLFVLFSYPFLLGIIGFAPVTFLFLALLLRFVEPQRWSIVLGGAAAGTMVTYFVFQYWLNMQFPRGVFGI